tara:strand:+ start:271 stop:570 length:300 start_codon:yes stop_codon:yes gene_type:complete
MKTIQLERVSILDSQAFNLGGGYNEKGQQCAAADVGDGLVFFVDIARDLVYFFSCDFRVSAIRQAYLMNQSVHVEVDDFMSEIDARQALEDLAETAPSL